MVQEICNSNRFENLQENNTRYVTYTFNKKNKNDMYIKKIIDFLINIQPRCENCTYCFIDGEEYCDCKIFGFLDDNKSKNPNHDGSICSFYLQET